MERISSAERDCHNWEYRGVRYWLISLADVLDTYVLRHRTRRVCLWLCGHAWWDTGWKDIDSTEALSELREALAAVEHDRWASWAADIAATETLTPGRLERWHAPISEPYSTLTEAQKDQDREWADKVLAVLRKHGHNV